MKLVSIIIPVYNRENLVKNAIMSAINQEYKQTEIILIDDGSTDNTLQVLEEFKDKYPNIKLISKNNEGQAKARDDGLKIANGDFITFLDSDDIINRHYISGLIEAQKETNSNITLARVSLNLLPLFTIPYKKLPRHFEISNRKDTLLAIWVGTTAKLYKRESVPQTDCNLRVNEDLAVTYYNSIKANTISTNNTSHYTLRLADNSLTKALLRNNLGNISNVLKPLEIERELFITNGLYDEYYDELESIFIHNIIERILIINLNRDLNQEQKRELIIPLIQYLNYRFPNWKNNKYYKNNFNNGSFYSTCYSILTKLSIRRNETKDEIDYDGIVSSYGKKLQIKK